MASVSKGVVLLAGNADDVFEGTVACGGGSLHGERAYRVASEVKGQVDGLVASPRLVRRR